MYYVEFCDYETHFTSLTDAIKACVHEMKLHDYYNVIEIYKDRDSRRPSGYVQTNGLHYFYVTFYKRRKTARRLDDNGNFIQPAVNRLSAKRRY